MNRKRSRLWRFFTCINEDSAKCDICLSKYSIKGGSTSNLKKHLMFKHRVAYESISPREKKINDLLFNVVVKGLHPFSIVEEDAVKDLVEFFEPGYRMPSRYLLSNPLLDAHYLEVKRRLKEELQHAKYISITTNGWTFRATTSYQMVTAHYLINWELNSSLLGCFECQEKQTAVYLKEELCRLLSFWEIDKKISACITDNASNMKAAVRLAKLNDLSCVAHTVNLVMYVGLKGPNVERLIQKIKGIVEYFQKSTIATEKLLSVQQQMKPTEKPLKLKMDVVASWNNTLDMLERLSLLQEPLEAALEIVHDPMESLSEIEWRCLPEIIQVLKLFKQLTEEASAANRVTGSMVVAMTENVKQLLNNFNTSFETPIGKELLTGTISEFQARFLTPDYDSVLLKATLLDPRFKTLAFRINCSAYKSAKVAVQTELQTLFDSKRQQLVALEPASTSSSNDYADSFWKVFDKAVKANSTSSANSTSIVTLNRYLEEGFIRRYECPLQWWKAREFRYPELSDLAQKYLSVVATSVTSEIIFSKSGQIVSEKRSSIHPKRMERVLFLNVNRRFLP